MIYIVVSMLIALPIITAFVFVLAILKHQSKDEKGSIKISLKILNLVKLCIHTKAERTTTNKRK